jgi:hypothetical protein
LLRLNRIRLKLAPVQQVRVEVGVVSVHRSTSNPRDVGARVRHASFCAGAAEWIKSCQRCPAADHLPQK